MQSWICKYRALFQQILTLTPIKIKSAAVTVRKVPQLQRVIWTLMFDNDIDERNKPMCC